MRVPDGTKIPAPLVRKAMRSLEAPADELMGLGVITSGDTLATVLPQLTARLLSAVIDDPLVSGVYEQAYTAFRRRSSLQLLNLEHQVQFTELPWVNALTPFRSRRPSAASAAMHTLRQTTMLALTSFPHALLPNPLVSELRALAKQAELELPVVEEVAADIFMGNELTNPLLDIFEATHRIELIQIPGSVALSSEPVTGGIGSPFYALCCRELIGHSSGIAAPAHQS